MRRGKKGGSRAAIMLGTLFLVLVCCSSYAFGMSVSGDTFSVTWWYPSAGGVIFSDSTVVPGTVNPGMGVDYVTVNDGQIILYNSTMGWSGSSGFNGFVFSDLTQPVTFTSFTLASVTGDLPPVDPILSYSGNQLLVNFNADSSGNIGSGYGINYVFNFTCETSAVPLPPSVWLFLPGLAALPLWRKRRLS